MDPAAVPAPRKHRSRERPPVPTHALYSRPAGERWAIGEMCVIHAQVHRVVTMSMISMILEDSMFADACGVPMGTNMFVHLLDLGAR